MRDDSAQRREWTVTGMDCASCATKVQNALGRLPGVSEVRVGVMSERLSLHLLPGVGADADVEEAVRRLGYGITPRDSAAVHDHDDHGHAGSCCGGHASAGDPASAGDTGHHHDHGSVAGDAAHGSHVHDDPAERDKRWFQTAKGRLVLLTGALLACAWAVEMLVGASYGYWAFLAACLIGVAPVARRAFEAARMGQPFTIESLMTIAVVGALWIGAAEEAALVVFLFAVGEVLEGVAAGKARDGIRALADLVPKTARLEERGVVREVAADTLRIGQTVLVRPGDRIPADGEIADGTSGIDESPVTGESVPLTKEPGEAVFAGSINTEAVLRVTVTKEPSDNTIARIIRLVEDAEEARAPTERFIDRFSRWYMPAIVALAALVVLVPPLAFGADWDIWVYRGLALLLIGCPCALVISVPASIASSLSAGARKGLLMKGGAVIEATAAVRTVAFDKTGTLTHGRPEVVDIRPAAGVEAAELLAVAAGVEAGSSHPLARAVLKRAGADGVAALSAGNARAMPGKGAEAMIDGVRAVVASPRHAATEGGIDAPGAQLAQTMETEGKTVVAVYREGRPLGILALRDEAREDAREAIAQLQRMGVGAVMLTGDNPRTAKAVAGGLGVDFKAGMMPEDKLATVREIGEQGGVMMIGDGINDAPALKQAAVGVAMGSGTDVALETADAAILRDRVVDVPALIRLARATMGNIHQNVAIALGLKGIFLVTSILGITGLWIAILADTGATVLVTLNALRLLGFDPTRERAHAADLR